MVYACLPGRSNTTRWHRIGYRTLALLDGFRGALGLALVLDSVRALFRPEAALLGLFLRWPGGGTLPVLDGILLGAALLFRSRLSAVVLTAHLALAAIDTGEFYALRSSGLPSAPVPFTMVTFALLAAAIARNFYDGRPAGWGWTATGAALSAPLLLVLLLFSFGTTDYARPAQAIVVLGARVLQDGSPSLALSDRVRHGARLLRAGLAPRLVLSGAPEEVASMARLAVECGVPEEALVLDPEGLSTQATMAHLADRRIIAVSHYYHLARVKMIARRMGIDCRTAPCLMTRRLAREPFFIARECAALVKAYFVRG
jgi:hypothetical protein